MSRTTINAAAEVSLAGIDPMAFLAAGPFEAQLMQGIAGRHIEHQVARDDALAVRIANQVGKLLGG